MSIEKILIVDDEMIIRNFLAETLKRRQFDVTTAENGQRAFALLKDNTYDLVITDMKMPDTTGIEVLKRVKSASPDTIVIVITAYASIETAVEAMKLGAFHYLIKPFSPDTIEAVIEKAREHQSLLVENQFLRDEVANKNNRSNHILVGESLVMKKILEEVKRIAKSNASVFINGESGSGKEVIAHAVHHHSLRKNRPYIRVNCAAIPETLIESEFFGHEKGSFTGANNKRIGRFELADKGTLLLDEITEIPIGLQAKLLRVIQEKELERVGGSNLIKVDTRIVSTSNRNMLEAIDEKLFREDLYYRLNVIPIDIPPLRDRRDDIIPLANHFLQHFSVENHKKKKTFSSNAEKFMLDYPWPGNVRELANIIERAVVMDYDSTVAAEHLSIPTGKVQAKPSQTNTKTEESILPKGITLHELEKRMIIESLEVNQQNRTKTAETLGISIRTLRNKLHDYNQTEKST
jgi:two-component system response regulator AtoC